MQSKFKSFLRSNHPRQRILHSKIVPAICLYHSFFSRGECCVVIQRKPVLTLRIVFVAIEWYQAISCIALDTTFFLLRSATQSSARRCGKVKGSQKLNTSETYPSKKLIYSMLVFSRPDLHHLIHSNRVIPRAHRLSGSRLLLLGQ